MSENGQPEPPRLYRVTIVRPSPDPKTPNLKVKAAEELFLFRDDDLQVSSSETAREKINKLYENLLPGWEVRIAEEPFVVTGGTPAIVGTCPRASCPNFGKPEQNRFFCRKCGESMSLKMLATEK
ncbi:MAG: hypothetical protein ABII19_00525 [Patescibacteria group bacterium]